MLSKRKTRHGVLLAVLAGGCGHDNLQSATSHGQPETDSFDPSAGSLTAGSFSTTGMDGGTGETGGPNACEDANKRCAHEFTLADSGYASVAVFGSFAADGWENGVAMALDGGTWRATLALPWADDTQYKFRLDDATWSTDPDNPTTVPDGSGGENSVVAAMMCDDFTCEPDVIGTFDWRDSVIYFVFVDRFFNGDVANDGGVGVPAASDWQGGDWAGVTQKIDEGYFSDLGVNTLWVTVPLDNTNMSGLGTDGMDYSAYHGYWPQDLAAAEEHFGTMAELQQLIDTAHDNDLKVLFDYAMNHVHVSSPVYADNPDWFWPNDNGGGGNCVCGDGCGWDGADGRRCWFTSYLPDFNFGNDAARAFSIDNAMTWIENTGVDGFRLDAVKHIEDAWLLDLRERVRDDVEPLTGEHFYMVGETFTGDQGTIAYYVNPDMLDGQFDFPLRMQMARNVLMRQGTMQELADFMDTNDGYYGAAIMSTFIGNHDIPRAIHLAEDAPLWNDQWTDGKDRAWSNLPALPGGMSAFERLGNAFTIIMTTPGAPLVYYGDEIGLPGGGDPDNRRFMQWGGLSGGQQFLLDHLRALIQIRRDHAATRRGTRESLSAAADTLAYAMRFGGDEVYVAINRGDSPSTVSGLPAGSLSDALGGGSVTGPDVMVPARSARVLIPR